MAYPLGTRERDVLGIRRKAHRLADAHHYDDLPGPLVRDVVHDECHRRAPASSRVPVRHDAALLAPRAGGGGRGGDFSSHMPSPSVFFPKRLQGTALGIQAGVGNFGVSLAQFASPWIIGFAAIGTSQTLIKGGASSQVWLQNAALWYVPLLLLLGILAWFSLRSVPVLASFKEQLDIFHNKHTWVCTITYAMTFGPFSGFFGGVP